MKRVDTEKAPKAIGPYSQAIQMEDLIFTSGQLPLNPQTGELESEIGSATKQSIENIKAILEEAGSSLEKVIKVTIFIHDMNDFSKVNEVYGQYFQDHKPARSCVAVKSLPKNALVEIEAIAKR